ncbi:hypothetical protein LguiB_026125 [Lonicera macranthoides]
MRRKRSHMLHASMGIYVFKKEILLNLLRLTYLMITGKILIQSHSSLKPTLPLPHTECIIDKNARIGKNVVIANSEGIQEAGKSSEGFYIRSGITCCQRIKAWSVMVASVDTQEEILVKA